MKLVRASKLKPEPRRGYLRKVLYEGAADGTKYVFLEATIPPGDASEPHYHKAGEEVFLFLTPGRVVVDGNSFDVEAGDVVVVEPGEVHSVVSGGSEVRLVVLRIPYLEGDRYVARGAPGGG